MSDKEQLLETIRKILALADPSKNDSDNQVATALAKAHELMRKHSISMAEIHKGAGSTWGVKEIFTEVMPQIDTFSKYILQAMCDLFDCQWVIQRFGRDYKYKLRLIILGEDADATICIDVWKYLNGVAKKNARVRYGPSWNVSHRSYAEAFGHMLCVRVKQIRE